MRRCALVLLVTMTLAGCSGSPGAWTPPANESAGSSGHPVDAAFPSEVAGLPVISVADAVGLLQTGKLDGQAVAVAGYYDQFTPSCPYPGRYIGPLEAWCRFASFTDTRTDAKLCEPMGSNGTSCHQPSGTNLSPWFMTETSGNTLGWASAGATGEPNDLVLIGPRSRGSLPIPWRQETLVACVRYQLAKAVSK